MSSFCHKCGTEVGDAKFCRECGSAINVVAPDTGATQATPPKSPRSYNQVATLLVIIGILFFLNEFAPYVTEPHKVTYTVTGSYVGFVELTYSNESGGTEQKTVALPWKLEFKAQHNAFVYISAQKQGENGAIDAVIYLDGNVIQEASANSRYGIASASGRVP